MKETQKAKIQRLETENEELKAELESLSAKYSELLNHADDVALSSPAYKQLERELFIQQEAAKMYRRKFEKCEKVRYSQAERLEVLQKLIDEREVKNPRNAGRKPKLTEAQIQEILTLRKQGQTIKALAEQFNCSSGLISKILKTE